MDVMASDNYSITSRIPNASLVTNIKIASQYL